MSENDALVGRAIEKLNVDEASFEEWQRGGAWLMAVDNQTGTAVSWAAAHEDSGETPFRAIPPGLSVRHVIGTTFSFATRYSGGGRRFVLALSNPMLGARKIDIQDQDTNPADVWNGMDNGDDTPSSIKEPDPNRALLHHPACSATQAAVRSMRIRPLPTAGSDST